jgi:hypothetical protein
MTLECNLADLGTEHSVTTGGFREAELHRLLFGVESEERTVVSVSFAANRKIRG